MMFINFFNVFNIVIMGDYMMFKSNLGGIFFYKGLINGNGCFLIIWMYYGEIFFYI